ncbi:hypothetical protein [Acidiphilium multivorum]|uniref:hypothetical protein n=1 Tax=Acidiphilium multivorum TaxID=62140 RepID=UPI001B8CFC11|nr:hypothetical protein [Acidiphilium multivorum]MBS3022815.1 hypothetical protein [Acidiphilium multivorum]
MSAALSTSPLLPRLRAAGAEVVLRGQRPVVQHASRVPPALMAEARARRDDLAAELLAEADDETAYQGEERAAVIAEGDPAAVVPHDMPVSWVDPTIQPTPGARCRCCRGASWWCEAARPKGWRCSTCHPPLGAGPVREVQT